MEILTEDIELEGGGDEIFPDRRWDGGAGSGEICLGDGCELAPPPSLHDLGVVSPLFGYSKVGSRKTTDLKVYPYIE
jgi:hypothetical protein